jgi:hypothetical protein
MDGREQTIQYLTTKKKTLGELREKFMQPVLEIDKVLAAVSVTLASILNEKPPVVENGFPISKIRNMTQTQALIAIAEYNGGTIKSLEVKSILIAAKLMKNTKNAAGMVNGVITRSEAFERVRRGEYRLKTQVNDAGKVMLTAEKLAGGAPLAMFAPKPTFQ